MRYSKLFGKTLRQAPKDETAKNAIFLTRAGFVQKLAAGIYELLPLGLRVVDKISNIVREEMNSISAQEVFLTVLQPRQIWAETGRWEKLKGDMYQLKDSSKKDFGLGFTHEEPMIDLVRNHISSYRDLPLYLYQIQGKFRDEPRPRSGLIRGREFLMKDLYSFSASRAELDDYYKTVAAAYKKIFDRIGLKTVYTEAAGGVFTKEHTHEFQVLSPAGEDTIYYCPNGDFSQNKEIAQVKEGDACPVCGEKVEKARAIEVGNIFRFYDVMSKQMSLHFTDKKGEEKPVFLGSYGIGITRSMAAIVEVYHDEKGVIWPKQVAPFAAHLLVLGNESKVLRRAEEAYERLKKAGIEVLYDDRQEVSAGEKFTNSDLIGIPIRLVISETTGDRIEWKERPKKEARSINFELALKKLVES